MEVGRKELHMKSKRSWKQRCGMRLARLACRALIALLVIVAAPACHRSAHGDVRSTTDSQAVATPTTDCGRCSAAAPAVASSAQTDIVQASTLPTVTQQPVMRVALFIDQTGSMEQARVPHVSADSVT